MLNQVRSFITNEIPVGPHLPQGFHFASEGRLAYELVLDASPSMDESDYPPTRFRAAKQAATGFVNKCVEQTPEALVGVIFYAESATVASPLLPVKAHCRQLHNAIKLGRINCSTNIGAGLTLAGRELMAAGPAVSPAIVLLTDGHSNTGPSPLGVASQLKNRGIRLDIVGIGGSPSDVNESELKRMASVQEGQRRYWFIRDTTMLVQRFEALALGKL